MLLILLIGLMLIGLMLIGLNASKLNASSLHYFYYLYTIYIAFIYYLFLLTDCQVDGMNENNMGMTFIVLRYEKKSYRICELKLHATRLR